MAVTKIFFCQSKLIHSMMFFITRLCKSSRFLTVPHFICHLIKPGYLFLRILSTVTSSHRSRNITELANLWSGTQLIFFKVAIIFPMCFTFFPIQEPCNWSVIISTTLKNCWLFLFCVYTIHKRLFPLYLKNLQTKTGKMKAKRENYIPQKKKK